MKKTTAIMIAALLFCFCGCTNPSATDTPKNTEWRCLSITNVETWQETYSIAGYISIYTLDGIETTSLDEKAYTVRVRKLDGTMETVHITGLTDSNLVYIRSSKDYDEDMSDFWWIITPDSSQSGRYN